MIVSAVPNEKSLRVVLLATVGGIKGRFETYLSTISGIDISHAISPLNGDTATMYTMEIANNISGQHLKYSWDMILADGRAVNLLITEQERV